MQYACTGELVDHAHGICSVVDDIPGCCRPDGSGSAGDDEAGHLEEIREKV